MASDEERLSASAPPNRPLERRALIDALCAALVSRDAIALIAPAGYGKTTAVAAALAECGRRHAWYRARAWERGNFVAALVAEIRNVRPDFGRMTLALASRYPAAEPDSDGEAPSLASLGERLGATFAAELAHVRDDLAIVIDDAHHLHDDPQFAPFVTGVLDALPTGIRIILMARSAPRLPFAQWIAAGRCMTFSADDLRFSDSEVRELAMHFGAGEAISFEALRERFDGWPAGLALFFAAGERTIPAEGRSLDAYSAYLLDANINALDERLVEFLEATCVYERLDASVLERDPGVDDVRARLAAVERSGVMVGVERPGRTYRLHPLLREALRDRVRARDGDGALARAHRRAAATLEAVVGPEPALYHVERATDPTFAATFLLRHASSFFIAGSGERAARIARGYAQAGPLAGAVAALLDAMLLRQYGLPGAADRLKAGMHLARAAESTEALVALRLVATEDELAHGTLPTPERLAWLEDEATNARDPRTSAEASMYAGWTYAIAGDFARARAASQRALASAGALLVPRVRSTALDAYVATCSGSFDEADRELTLVLGELEHSDALVLLANTLVWYARLALLWGDVASARDYAQQGHALALRLDLGAELAGVALARVQIAALDRDVRAMRDAADDARRFGSTAWYATDRDRSLALATLLDARGTFAAASPLEAAARLTRLNDLSLPPIQRLCAAIDEAAYRRAAGSEVGVTSLSAMLGESAHLRAHDALDGVELARALDLARALGATIPADLVRANEERFGALLRERRAREERFVERRDPVLAALLERSTSDEGRRETPTRAARTSAASAVETLTKREREILALLALGLTNKEMAQRLIVSPRTIDTHVERVLAKLGVPSRTRAVAAALRYGLVATP